MMGSEHKFEEKLIALIHKGLKDFLNYDYVFQVRKMEY